MNRSAGSVALLAVTALLVGSAAMGCARSNGGPAQTTTGPSSVVQATGADATGAPAPTATQTTDDVAATPTYATPSILPTQAPAATADPIDSALMGLDQLLSGVTSSLSGTDAAASGGE